MDGTYRQVALIRCGVYADHLGRLQFEGVRTSPHICPLKRRYGGAHGSFPAPRTKEGS